VEVEISVIGGTATPGVDYSGLPAVAFFAVGATTAKMMIPIINDDLVEGAETVELQLRNPAGGAVLGAKTNAIITIKNDDTYDASGMALIPAGAFTMGDTFGEGENDELPLHAVYLSAFYMDRAEVSETLWEEVYDWATNHGYSFEGGVARLLPALPVQIVSWYDSVKWCNARSEQEGRMPAYYTDAGQTTVYRRGEVEPFVKWNAGYRLPTEAEWEKAARGGASELRFPWGNTISHSQANYYSTNRYAYDVSPTRGYHPAFKYNPALNRGYFVSPVGYFAPNGYGLFDMAGNVIEWCWDWYGSYSDASQSDPQGPISGTNRVLRGGCFYVDANICRTANRSAGYPTRRDWGGGFRSVLPQGQP
jgi:formylglycine-generating enzyme